MDKHEKRNSKLPITDQRALERIAYHERQIKILSKRPRKGVTAELKERRLRIWKHNSFLGTCAFAEKGLYAILYSDTATDEAKAQANALIPELKALDALLRSRKD